MSIIKPVKVALMWHMHQPVYQEPDSGPLAMPWVRFHGTKDYLDMLQAAVEHDGLKVTFNLVPSLIDQLSAYESGATDPHLELSRAEAEELSLSQRTEILSTFFSANAPHMIDPYPRYRQLFRKAKSATGSDILSSLFSVEEIRDLQVWSNLVWVDPRFKTQEPIKSLFDQGRQFNSAQKHQLLDWQLNHLKKIIPAYRDALLAQKIDISFTPYYHPILPLLYNVESALEATPNINLPRRPFAHPEDARTQMEMACRRYEELFDCPLQGMWPSEGSVSEEIVSMAAELGIRWMASDEEVLRCSLEKGNQVSESINPHRVYEHQSGMKLFFRDHGLSDRIGFVYSGWKSSLAVADFISYVTGLREKAGREIDDTIIPVILDGENAWEYYENDGTEFLSEFYHALAHNPEIEVVGMNDAAESLTPLPLKSIFAGSWINRNFRIWIGHPEDNAAWDLLAQTRSDLVQFEKENREANPDDLQKAWKQIYIAEGSDWCWWYGDDHRGPDNAHFDVLYRRHLAAVYEILELSVPANLLIPIRLTGEAPLTTTPDSLITPLIDGRETYFYEWAGSGIHDCQRFGTTMHPADQVISTIQLAYDHECVYIRLDFVSMKHLESIKEGRIVLCGKTPEGWSFALDVSEPDRCEEERGIVACLDKILEVSIKRQSLWPDGYGNLDLSVNVMSAESLIEQWPTGDPIRLDVARSGEELFWPE